MLSVWPNAVAHIDADAFFASCEQAMNPELKSQPVVTGKERNIVASMSYEAKAMGILRGMPIFRAQKICPALRVLPSDYETYCLISQRMFSIMRRFTPTVEEYSIDEGFLELNGLRRLYRKGYPEIAGDIRQAIEKELGIPVSAGLSTTKTLAKLASKYRKPRGFTAVPGTRIHGFLPNIQAGQVCGLGPNTSALLRKRNIVTAWDYVRTPEGQIKDLLGKTGVELWHELRGEMVYPVNPRAKTVYASISKTKTFTPPSSDYNYLKAQLYRNTESAFLKLRRHGLRTKSLAIFLTHQNFQTFGLEGKLSRESVSPVEAFPLIEKMLRSLFREHRPCRRTGVVLAALKPDTSLQYDLFEAPLGMLRTKNLYQSIDQINAAFGKHTVSSAAGLYLARENPPGLELNGRHALAERKTIRLPGETCRQRINLPLARMKI